MDQVSLRSATNIANTGTGAGFGSRDAVRFASAKGEVRKVRGGFQGARTVERPDQGRTVTLRRCLPGMGTLEHLQKHPLAIERDEGDHKRPRLMSGFTPARTGLAGFAVLLSAAATVALKRFP